MKQFLIVVGLILAAPVVLLIVAISYILKWVIVPILKAPQYLKQKFKRNEDLGKGGMLGADPKQKYY